MTKKERAAIQGFFNTLTKLDEEKDKAFKELQDMNREITGTAWCCAQTNRDDLMRAGVTKAACVYDRYVKAGAKEDLLREFGQVLADELNFWKH